MDGEARSASRLENTSNLVHCQSLHIRSEGFTVGDFVYPSCLCYHHLPCAYSYFIVRNYGVLVRSFVRDCTRHTLPERNARDPV